MIHRFTQSIRDVSETLPVPMSEREYAEFLMKRGEKLAFHSGRFWREATIGFHMPVHWLGRVPAEAATRPDSLCWGFRALLPEEDKHFVNATMPVHLATDVQGYDLESLPSNRKRKIRRFLEEVEVVEVLNSNLLVDQGYEVFLSSHSRTGYGRLLTREQYLKYVEGYFQNKGVLILAALLDGKLGGYTVNHLIDGTLYSEEAVFATEALSANISSGLDFTLMQICRRAGYVSEVTLGLEMPENPSIKKFKEEMRFPVVHLPAKVWFAPFTETILRQFYPNKYYRLTGRHEVVRTRLAGEERGPS